MFKIKRAYEEPERTDGLRILVDRLWPRGLKKDGARIDLWLKDIAPSPKLRVWFGHRPERFDEFAKRYRVELRGNKALTQDLKAKAKKGIVTLLYAAADTEHNHARVLRDFLRLPR